MEFVLVIPILGIILAMTMFFGWAMLHKHQIVIADRYAAWKRVETGAWPTTDELNQGCLGDRASNVSISGSGASTDTPADLVDETGQYGSNAGRLADDLVLDLFPKGRRAAVSAQFPAHKAVWEAVTEGRTTFHSRHSREGITWRCDEARCWKTLRDDFYQNLDDRLQSVPDPGDGMADMIRSLYLAHWPDRIDQDR